MPSSGPEDWAEGILDAIRRHEQERSSSPREAAPGVDERSSAGEPSRSRDSLGERWLGVVGRSTDGREVPTAGPSPIRPGDQARTPSDPVLVGQVALDLRIIDERCLKECLLDLEKARGARPDLSLEDILIRRGALTPEDALRIRHELGRRSGGISTLSRYETRERLGEGTTAIVFRAWDKDLQRFVALKVMREVAGLSPVARERFRREAVAAAGLTHPHVVTLHDAGETQDGQLYLVLELVAGRSLKDYLKEGEHTPREIVGLIERTARGVAAAHEKGIVHRDLKPANILVTNAGEPKVGDFGLAHLMDSTAELTRSGTTLGTPLYMSPEQVHGRLKDLTPRADVYALGAILYEATVGRPPHEGETVTEIYQKAVHEEPISPRRAKPEIARDLETIILKALDKDPAKRYPTAWEIAEDLKRYLEGEPILARPTTAAGRLWRKAVKRRAILLPTAAAILLGVLAGVVASRKPRAPGRVLFFERLEGNVRTIHEGRPSPAQQGQILGRGWGVETGPSPSLGVLRFEDGTQVEIEADTSMSDLAAGPGKRLFTSKGSLRAEVPRQAQEGSLIIVTPFGEAKGVGARYRTLIQADPVASLRLEVEEGDVELKTRDGKTAVIGGGTCAIAAEGAELVVGPFARLDLGGGVWMDLVPIPPGTFTMGGTETPMEMPQHRVVITRGYFLGKTPVTRRQFGAFVKATGYATDAEKEGRAYGWIDGAWKEVVGASWKNPKLFAQSDDHPAMCISWNDARAFCDWAAKKTGRGVSLPTEAEWEYACRAGTTTRWSFGDDDKTLSDYAWTSKNSGMQTQPVGQKKPNAWGLLDMHGNVWEWCLDYSGPYSGTAVDPTGPASGDRLCLRGGSWASGSVDCRSASRNETPASARNSNNGFRAALR